MRRGITFVGLPVLALGGLLWWRGGGPPDGAERKADLTTFAVARGDLPIQITENGTLVAKESRKVVPAFRSEAKITFLLEEGKSVAEGDVICRCDSMSLQNQVEQQEMEIVQAEAALVTAQTELEIQQAENAASIEKAQITLELVRLEQEKYREGDAPQDRRTLEVAIKDAKTEYNLAKKRYDDSLRLVEQDFIKRSELEQHEIEFDKATVRMNSSERALEVFDKYTMPMTLRKNGNAVGDAERDFDTAQKRAKSRLNQRQTDALQAEKRIKRLKAQLEERKKDIENMTMKAPCPGILIYGDPREPWYREQVKVGGTIWGGNTLMTIPDLRVMQVKIAVHEADINKVKDGLTAVVTMDTYPGLTLHGEVSRVANIAAAGNPWRDSDSEVKRFDVEIVLKDTSEQQLKPGISAKATILIDTRKAALYVPLQCVFLENGVHQCLVAGPAGPTRRTVKVGLSNDTYTEILDGLTEGEHVLLYNPLLKGDSGAAKPDGAKPDAKAEGAAPDADAASGTEQGAAAATAAEASGAAGAEPVPATTPTAPATAERDH